MSKIAIESGGSINSTDSKSLVADALKLKDEQKQSEKEYVE